MNDLLTPRAQRVVKLQRVALLATVVGVPFVVYHLLQSFGVSGALFWITMVVGSVIAINYVFKIALFLIVMSVYENNIELMQEECEQMKFAPIPEEEPQAPVQEMVTLTVVSKPEKPIGHYLDAELWEWIEFEINGERVIGRFEDTINPKQLETYKVPDNMLLFPPGVLYKFDEPQSQVD